MKVNLKLHTISHIIKSILGSLEFIISKQVSCNALYVVNFHGTELKFIENFEKQIRFLKSNFNIITPNQVEHFYSNKLNNNNHPFLLITFDDGIKNNIHAIDILNKHEIKALFFIVPNFIDCPIKEQKQFFIKNIRNNINQSIFTDVEDFISLTWEDLDKIVRSGHKIGSHTLTHTIIANESTIENSKNEIIKSKLVISEKLGINIDSFCSTNNTIESVEKKELDLIMNNYNYHFTTLPGANYQTDSKYFIKRSNIESFWLLGAVKYSLGNVDLRRWRKKKNIFNQIITSSKR